MTDVSKWIADSLTQLGSQRLVVDSHLDKILGQGHAWSPRQAVQLVESASAALPTWWKGRLSLAIPLEADERELTVVAPELSDLRSHHHTPPSLYLFAPEYVLSVALEGEIYRFGYAENPWSLDAKTWSIEFTSFRDRDGVQRHWEPADTVWVYFLGSQPSEEAGAAGDESGGMGTPAK